MKKLIILLILISLPIACFADNHAYGELFVGTTGDSNYSNGTVSFTCYDNGDFIWEGVGVTLSYPFNTVSPPAIISLDVPFRLAVTPDFLITLTPSVFGVIGYYPKNTVGLSGSLGIALYGPGHAGASASLGYRHYNAYFSNTWFASIGLIIR
jgi:hypothetical protein